MSRVSSAALVPKRVACSASTSGAMAIWPSSQGSPGARSGSSGRSHSSEMTSVGASTPRHSRLRSRMERAPTTLTETAQDRSTPSSQSTRSKTRESSASSTASTHPSSASSASDRLMTCPPPRARAPRPRRQPRCAPRAHGARCRRGRGRQRRCRRCPRALAARRRGRTAP